VIYKVISKTTLPEAQVKAEIAREIAQQKYKAAIKAVMDSAQTEFNEQYFGPMAPRPPDAPVMPRRSGR
jgi:protein involved in ribonucleotide reduction